MLPTNILPSFFANSPKTLSLELVTYSGILPNSNSSTGGICSNARRGKLYTPLRGSLRKCTPGLKSTRVRPWAREAMGTVSSRGKAAKVVEVEERVRG